MSVSRAAATFFLLILLLLCAPLVARADTDSNSLSADKVCINPKADYSCDYRQRSQKPGKVCWYNYPCKADPIGNAVPASGGCIAQNVCRAKQCGGGPCKTTDVPVKPTGQTPSAQPPPQLPNIPSPSGGGSGGGQQPESPTAPPRDNSILCWALGSCSSPDATGQPTAGSAQDFERSLGGLGGLNDRGSPSQGPNAPSAPEGEFWSNIAKFLSPSSPSPSDTGLTDMSNTRLPANYGQSTFGLPTDSDGTDQYMSQFEESPTREYAWYDPRGWFTSPAPQEPDPFPTAATDPAPPASQPESNVAGNDEKLPPNSQPTSLPNAAQTQPEPLRVGPGGRVDPVEFAKSVAEKAAQIDTSTWPEKTLRDLGRIGVTDPTDPYQLAEGVTKLAMQECGFSFNCAYVKNPNENSIGVLQFGVGDQFGPNGTPLTLSDVRNPDKSVDAFFEAAQQGKLSNTFGPIQRGGGQVLQHGGWYDANVAPYLTPVSGPAEPFGPVAVGPPPPAPAAFTTEDPYMSVEPSPSPTPSSNPIVAIGNWFSDIGNRISDSWTTANTSLGQNDTGLGPIDQNMLFEPSPTPPTLFERLFGTRQPEPDSFPAEATDIDRTPPSPTPSSNPIAAIGNWISGSWTSANEGLLAVQDSTLDPTDQNMSQFEQSPAPKYAWYDPLGLFTSPVSQGPGDFPADATDIDGISREPVNTTDTPAPMPESVPLPPPRPNVLPYGPDSDIGKTGLEAVAKEVLAKEGGPLADLSDKATTQAVDAMRKSLIATGLPNQLCDGCSVSKDGKDIVFPDSGAINADVLKDERFLGELEKTIIAQEKTYLLPELFGEIGAQELANDFRTAFQPPVAPASEPTPSSNPITAIVNWFSGIWTSANGGPLAVQDGPPDTTDPKMSQFEPSPAPEYAWYKPWTWGGSAPEPDSFPPDAERIDIDGATPSPTPSSNPITDFGNWLSGTWTSANAPFLADENSGTLAEAPPTVSTAELEGGAPSASPSIPGQADVQAGTENQFPNCTEGPCVGAPTPRPRPDFEAQQQSAIKTLAKLTPDMSAGLKALNNAGITGADEKTIEKGMATVPQARAAAVTLGDTVLVRQIDDYLAAQRSMQRAYKSDGGLAAWPWKDQVYSLGQSVIQTIDNRKYRK